ncbi:MAG: HigA family addiction module antitoxin [Terriglobales bacterium]
MTSRSWITTRNKHRRRAKPRRVFAVHPGEILKTEFMEPMGISAYELAKALSFPGIYEVVRGERAVSADTAIRLGKYLDLPAQFWLNLQNDYDLRLAEGKGVGREIKPRDVAEENAVGHDMASAARAIEYNKEP